MRYTLTTIFLFCFAGLYAQVNTTEVEEFIKEYVKEHRADETKIRAILNEAQFQQEIIDKISRPAEGTMTWERYRKIFVTEERTQAGLEFWKKYQKEVRTVSEQTGVNEEIILGIIGVETYFGRIMGTYRVLDALYTLGFGYPRRASFFKSELAKFLELTSKEKLDPLAIKGSYAGAMGFSQFMPSSYLAYAKSFKDDGSADLISDPADAIASVANYLKVHRWQQGEPVATKATFTRKVTNLNKQVIKPKNKLSDYTALGIKPAANHIPGSTPATLVILDNESDKEHWYGFYNFYVITRYNRSPMYAMAVYQLAEAMKSKKDW
ncbi:lytic murein transglycosylase B [Roseivirga thermotolerans]|uniref:Murein transglycosylase n=2 Tax=Roseivirga TaxID=290180 RepID=A0ABQ3I792_9BACT|nr:lytic murein transglycosylase B [Roseivirga thermotolerans]GHE60805.1 murein transglycosylase [Roseivirga thermotolerans]